MSANNVLCAQLTRDLFAISKFLFVLKIWIKFCRLVQNDMSTAVIWSKSKPEAEFQYVGRFGKFNGMTSRSHVPHCRVKNSIRHINKNLAIANRSRVSCARNTLRASTPCPEKKCHWFFCCNFYKYWRIFIIFRAQFWKRMPKSLA